MGTVGACEPLTLLLWPDPGNGLAVEGARRPRSTFVRTTVVLTVLSLVPDLIVDAAPATTALLMLTHLVAAAIVVPAVARRLAGS